MPSLVPHGRFGRNRALPMVFADRSTRWTVQPAALAMLEQVFTMESFPSRQLRASLAADLAVTERQVSLAGH